MSSKSLVHVIRKLGLGEGIYLNMRDFRIVTLSVQVTTNTDLFKRIDLFENAVEDWKRMNPLLNAKIIARDQNGDYFDCADENVKQDGVEFYFYDPAKSDIGEFRDPRNVEVYYIDDADYAKENLDQTFEEDLCHLIIERESLREIDLSVESNDLLWRLILIKLKPQTPSDAENSELKHNFMLLFSANHTILDGRSGYRGLLDLLNLVEINYDRDMDRKALIKPYEVMPPKEEIFEAIKTSPPYEIKLEHSSLPIVNFSDPDEESELHKRMKRFSHLMIHKLQAGDEYSESKLVQTSFAIGGFISLSSINESKFKTLTIGSEKMNRILDQCKKNGAKMNGFLSVVLSLANQILVTHLVGKDIINDDMSSILFNMIGLQQFIEGSSKYYGNHSLCIYNGQFVKELKSTLLSETCETDRFRVISMNPEAFWKLCQECSNEMHLKIKNGHQFRKSPTNFKQIREGHFNWGLSSFGNMPSSLSENLSKKTNCQITKFILANQNVADLKSRNFFAYTPSVNNNLFITLTYNSKVISENNIDIIFTIINDVVSHLTK